MTKVDEIFNDSYERCLRSGDFTGRFYDIFVASNKIVAQKFASTDGDKQRDMLDASLYTLLALRGSEPRRARALFTRIGKSRGSTGYDIPPELYDLWLDSLLRAVREYDDQCDAQVEAAWREVVTTGIDIIKSVHRAEPK